MRLRHGLLLLFAAAALSACGIKGDVKPPSNAAAAEQLNG